MEWTKIYDKTNYYKTAADQDNEEAMYGAKITTTDAGFDTEGNASYGYLTLSQIKDAMTTALGGTMLQHHSTRYCTLTTPNLFESL